MNEITKRLQTFASRGVEELFDHKEPADQILINETRREFEGDFTIVLFPLLKKVRKSPQELGEKLGNWLTEQLENVEKFTLVKGFLNLTFSDQFWIEFLIKSTQTLPWLEFERKDETVLVEYSSPNTNKPLHLGHVRNILLGWATSRIMEAVGFNVFRTQIVNDRGIAICKSMLAWEKFSGGETPESSNIKGDHFVGEYYVRFEKEFQKEYSAWQESSEAKEIYGDQKRENEPEETFFKRFKNTYFNEYSSLGREARDMLRGWEAGDPEVRKLWSKMNAWVYDGFDETYEKLGVYFDRSYYESETYLQGRQFVEDGLERGVFYKKEDGSVWIDLEDEGLDQKLVLRSDGTAVYITQDIGTAHLRYKDTKATRMIYVVADEQNYHFSALFEIMKKLDEPYADGLYHLSYGMIDLPTGKMKSREGTVVDADDLIEEIREEAAKAAEERGELAELQQEEQQKTVFAVAMSALKYFILKVNPRKRMVFNPQESLDLQGQTGPYIQYAFVRISGVRRKAAGMNLGKFDASISYQLADAERDLLRILFTYSEKLQQAADEHDPSIIAHYCYELARGFNKFWHELSILNAEDPKMVSFRLMLSELTGKNLQHGMDLLGIDMPERM